MKCVRAMTIALLNVLILLTVCCTSRHEATFARADSLMEEYPDSALALLEAIDTTTLTTDRDRARYAVLMSMALDKNYIDTTDFSVLQPAIDYYANHGNADDKLRTLYYKGRIHENRGDMPQAAECFTKAIELDGNITDSLSFARTLVAQAVVYWEMFKYDRSAKYRLTAAGIFARHGHKSASQRCLIAAYECYTNLHDYIKADKIAQIICTDSLEPLAIKRQFLYAELANLYHKYYYTNSLDTTKVSAVLDQYRLYGEKDYAMTWAESMLKDKSEAVSVYDSIPIPEKWNDRQSHFKIGAELHYENGEFEKSINLYRAYIRMFDDMITKVIIEETPFVEDRIHLEYEAKLQKQKKENYLVIGILGATVLIISILALYYRTRMLKASKSAVEAELAVEKANYEKLLEEWDALNELVENRKTGSDKISPILIKRFTELSDFLISYNANNQPMVRRKADKIIKDKAKFVDDIRLSLQSLCPRFIEYLQSKNLTTKEQNYACLYIIGLNGKDIGIFLDRPGHYNISSSIRTKLGMTEHDTNIGIHIRRLFEQYSR